MAVTICPHDGPGWPLYIWKPLYSSINLMPSSACSVSEPVDAADLLLEESSMAKDDRDPGNDVEENSFSKYFAYLTILSYDTINMDVKIRR